MTYESLFLRTEVEQAKWDNTRRGVVVIGGFVLFVIFALEMSPKPKHKHEHHHVAPPKKPSESSEPPHPNSLVAGADGRPTTVGSSQHPTHDHAFNPALNRSPLDLREFEDSREG